MNVRTLLFGAATLLLVPLAACGEPAADPAPAEPAPAGENRLIGYQVKRLDQLIDLTFDRLVADAGLSRREWQTLNALAAGPAGDAALTDALRPFWEVEQEDPREVVAALAERGWVGRDSDGRYVLTEAGRTTRAAAADSVGRIRDLAATGVSDQEFTEMMDVMARIIANLEQAA
ncbi:MarR family transcriptional regulator [Nocardia testacea]|uniref:MarR family transcriptional regulator n=1 Tax=Nocardia testacea TaxID=248551 RepID=UPI003C304696